MLLPTTVERNQSQSVRRAARHQTSCVMGRGRWGALRRLPLLGQTHRFLVQLDIKAPSKIDTIWVPRLSATPVPFSKQVVTGPPRPFAPHLARHLVTPSPCRFCPRAAWGEPSVPVLACIAPDLACHDAAW